MIRRYTPVPAVTAAVLLLIVVGTSCITALRSESLALSGPQAVTSPVKAHMLDGSTIIYRDGAAIEDDRVTGNGARYDIRLQRVDSVSAVALDSVLVMESFDTEADLARSIGYGLVALVVAPVAAMAFVIVVVFYALAAMFSGVAAGFTRSFRIRWSVPSRSSNRFTCSGRQTVTAGMSQTCSRAWTDSHTPAPGLASAMPSLRAWAKLRTMSSWRSRCLSKPLASGCISA